jgi:alpha,alpha-trehalase
MSRSNNPITPDRFDAVLFDLDGVITATAKVHAVCWKKLFDEYLRKRAADKKEPFRPFEIETDYKLYVDGKPRYEGVRSFLESRSIHLPYGKPDSPPDQESIFGLGNRKNEMLNDVIESEGVERIESSITLIRLLRSQGIKIAVVSSSANCRTILRAAGIEDLFDARVDGEVATQMKLTGKPAPDTFLAAAKQLGADPKRAVVVEDAISGVQAGRAGNFGLVIGVDRKGDAESLRDNGADIVVSDLEEIV